jgi:murein DD-endopeptidase MepM/ murein hydrolase activator NlpD
MKPPVKNLKWAKYPIGDVTQWFAENPELYSKAVIINGVPLTAHNGIDIVRPWGEHMFAVEDAKVTDVKNDAGGYGKHVRIRSTDGKRQWTYGHCSNIYVTEGQLVKEGQFIAQMGNTGFVVSGNTPYWEVNPYAGTHVHFGLRLYENGKVKNYDNGYFGAIDPLPFFLDPTLKSTKILKLASERQDKTLFQLGELMQKIGL